MTGGLFTNPLVQRPLQRRHHITVVNDPKTGVRCVPQAVTGMHAEIKIHLKHCQQSDLSTVIVGAVKARTDAKPT